MWVNFPSQSNNVRIFSRETSDFDTPYTFYISSNKIIFWTSKSAGGNDFSNPTSIIALHDSGWVHVVGIINTTYTSLFIDGVVQEVDAWTFGSKTSTENTLISASMRASGIQDYFNGTIDEIGIWNRSLSQAEITQLYNGGTGITYGIATGINVTLNAPVNNTTVFNPTVIFNATGSDDNALQNMSLIVNGSYIQTNSSVFNNTLTQFTYTLPSLSVYNWTVEACDNENNCLNATERIVTYSSNINVTLNAPVNALNSTSQTIIFNATGEDDTTLQNMSIILNGIYNGTNSSVFNNTLTQFSRTLADGFYNWTVEACDNLDNCVNATARNFTIDSTNPELIILAPSLIVNYHLVNTNLSLNWSANDTNIDTCWYNYGGVNTTVTCTDNSTNINITNVINRTIVFYVNDTFGLLNFTSISWEYLVFENSQTFNSVTFEGIIETFTANITRGESNTISIATLFYNETSNIGSSSISGNDSIITVNLTTPPIDADVNLTFFWNLQLSGGQSINLTSYNQTITSISLDNCSTNTVVLYNYTVVDEGNQSLLVDPANTTTELSLNLLDAGRENYLINFSRLYENENPFAVCLNVNINSSSYSVDSIIKYEAIGYSIEYYNIVDTTITNLTIPVNITLYDLAIADATEFRISFKGEDFTFVENALIFIDRQYIAENNSFKTVELPKTDSSGQTVGHFVRNDVIYNIRVIKDGEVLGSFNNINAFCTDFTIGDCQIVLEATPTDPTTFNYDEQVGVIFDSVPTYNNVTNAISFSFTTDDGTPKTILLTVTRRDIFGNRTLCNNTVTSASGTLACSINPNIDDTVLGTEIYVDGQLAVLSSVELEASDYGNLGYVLWFFLTFFFILLFGRSKTEVLIGITISFMGAIALGITRGSIVGRGSAGIWILVILILGIHKLNKENPQ